MEAIMMYVDLTEALPHICQKCGSEAENLQPCADRKLDRDEGEMNQVDLSNVVWWCASCWLSAYQQGKREVAIKYRHSQYYPGLNVLVSPKICKMNPQHILAGKIVQTCWGYYYPYSEVLGELSDHTRDVPVCLPGQPMPYHIPQGYILID
jgi:hypothetical protein